MSRFALVRCAIASLLILPACAQADTITFGNLNIPVLSAASPQTEGAFQYATSNPGWEVTNEIGNPASALATFWNDQISVTGDTLNITRVGGGLFTFNSVDWRTVEGANSDDVTITGLLSNVPVGSMAFTGSSTTFLTAASTILAPIDTLRLTVSLASGNNAMVFDNFVLTPQNGIAPVPLPAAAWAGMALIGAVGGKRLFRRAAHPADQDPVA